MSTGRCAGVAACCRLTIDAASGFETGAFSCCAHHAVPCAPQANQATLWSNANALAIVVGASSDDLRYLKSISLQLWLFGYELPGATGPSGRQQGTQPIACSAC